MPTLRFQGWWQAGKVKASHLPPPMSSPLLTSAGLLIDRNTGYRAGIKTLQRQTENGTKPNCVLKQKCSAKMVDKYEYVSRNHGRDHTSEDDPRQLLDQKECGNIRGLRRAPQTGSGAKRCLKTVSMSFVRCVVTFREIEIGLLLLVTT